MEEERRHFNTQHCREGFNNRGEEVEVTRSKVGVQVIENRLDTFMGQSTGKKPVRRTTGLNQ